MLSKETKNKTKMR